MLLYEFQSPDLVNSQRLYTLLRYWDNARGNEILPDPAFFLRDSLGEHFEFMTHLEVQGVAYQPRFMIVEHGYVIAEMYGAMCHGKYLDEVIPPAKLAGALESYTKAIERKSPIYTVAELSDAAGNEVVEERILLPFGDSIRGVTHIWTAIEPSSAVPDMEWRNLLGRPMVPAFVIKAAIDPSSGFSHRV